MSALTTHIQEAKAAGGDIADRIEQLLTQAHMEMLERFTPITSANVLQAWDWKRARIEQLLIAIEK